MQGGSLAKSRKNQKKYICYECTLKSSDFDDVESELLRSEVTLFILHVSHKSGLKALCVTASRA